MRLIEREWRRFVPSSCLLMVAIALLPLLGCSSKSDVAGIEYYCPMHPDKVAKEPGQCPICGMDLVPTSNYGYSTEPVPQPSSLYVPRSAVLLAGEKVTATR